MSTTTGGAAAFGSLGRRMLLGVLATSLALAALPGAAALGAPDERAAPPPHVEEHAYAEDVVLVELLPGTPAEERRSARRDAGAARTEPLSPLAPDAERLELQPGRDVPTAIRALERNPNVRFAEPDYLVEPLAEPDDPRYLDGSLWGMYSPTSDPSSEHGSRAADAWADGHTGTDDTYVVVIDTGLQVSHPDLAANVWTNPYEILDGTDTDGNGYVDDVHGWNFYHDTNEVYSGSHDDHGTHVAGTIGAVGNNGVGVVGVNWDVTMISAKFLGPNGGYTSDAIRAVDYATDLKVRHSLNIAATNNSWGGGGFSQALLDAIERGAEQDILFVAAAGNGGLFGGYNLDSTTSYPASYECTDGGKRDWDCVIAVAATTSTGGLASFSNYGKESVDLGAPGQSILSTTYGSSYGSKSGTSMAAPHVAGALALCASINPGLGADMLHGHLLESVTPTAALADRTISGGLLNVGAMAQRCTDGTQPLEITTSTLPEATAGSDYLAPLSARGGESPYTWTATDLPEGLQIADGAITGTTEILGDHEVTLTVTDATEPQESDTRVLTLTVVEPASLEVAGIEVETTGNRWLRGNATVAVTNHGAPAAGVTVAGDWSFSGDASWQLSQTGLTDDVGRAYFDTGNPRLTGGTYDFCVTSLALDSEVVTFASPVCSGDVDDPPETEDPEPDPDDPEPDPDDPTGPVDITWTTTNLGGGYWNAAVTLSSTDNSISYSYTSQRGVSSGEGTDPCGDGQCTFDIRLHNRDAYVDVTAWVTGEDSTTEVRIPKP